MPIPEYQTIMLPLLKFTGDGKEHSIKESVECVSKVCSLTEEQKNAFYEAKRVKIFY
jgi:restriction system protein